MKKLLPPSLMKQLLFIGLLFLAIAGCKKEANNKVSQQFNVKYNFDTSGEPSKITYTSIQEGKTITLINITTSPGVSNIYPAYKVQDYVKVGDYIKLEMSCSKQVIGYGIYVTQTKDGANGSITDRPMLGKAKIVNESGTYKAVLEHTFIADDFR